MDTWIIIFLIALLISQVVMWNLLCYAMGRMTTLERQVRALQMDQASLPSVEYDPWIPEM